MHKQKVPHKSNVPLVWRTAAWASAEWAGRASPRAASQLPNRVRERVIMWSQPSGFLCQTTSLDAHTPCCSERITHLVFDCFPNTLRVCFHFIRVSCPLHPFLGILLKPQPRILPHCYQNLQISAFTEGWRKSLKTLSRKRWWYFFVLLQSTSHCGSHHGKEQVTPSSLPQAISSSNCVLSCFYFMEMFSLII